MYRNQFRLSPECVCCCCCRTAQYRRIFFGPTTSGKAHYSRYSMLFIRIFNETQVQTMDSAWNVASKSNIFLISGDFELNSVRNGAEFKLSWTQFRKVIIKMGWTDFLFAVKIQCIHHNNIRTTIHYVESTAGVTTLRHKTHFARINKCHLFVINRMEDKACMQSILFSSVIDLFVFFVCASI